jgi:hypothetical protein
MHLKINQPENSAERGVSPPEYPARILSRRARKNTAAFTLVEVVISTAIVALIFGGIINAYIQSGKRLQWTGYSLAAQQMANSILEQARSGTWDPTIPENDVTNMILNLQGATYTSTNGTCTGYTTGILDVPISGTNTVTATSYVTVQMVNVAANVQVQYLRVDTVWPFGLWKNMRYYTNTVVTMIAPDNRSSNSF